MKGQSAIEFLVVSAAVVFFFVGFFAIIQNNINVKNSEKEMQIIQNIALDIQKEISLAAGSSDGYLRDFDVPLNVFGRDYNVSIIANSVYISGERLGISYKVAEVNGTIYKGVNTIRKENGIVYLNK